MSRRLSSASEALLPAGMKYEIILVDDGSADDTWQSIQAAVDKTSL